MKVEPIYVIDLMAMAFRSFFAFARNPLSTKHGFPTSALYGSAMFIHKLIQDEKPLFLFAAMESKEKTIRHSQFPAYKAHRDRMPDGLAEQLPYIFQLLELMGIPIVTVSGYEADDIIGTLAKRWGSKHHPFYIVSGDKDFMQLVNQDINILAPRKNEQWEKIDAAAVKEKFQVPPEEIVDLLGLMGDASDNVPGVPGVGEKTAAKLVSTYHSLEQLYAHMDEIKQPKLHNALLEHQDDALLSRELVRIHVNVPIDIELESVRFDPMHLGSMALHDFYEEFEFRQLAHKVLERQPQQSPQSTATPSKTSKAAVIPWFDVTTQASLDEWLGAMKSLRSASLLTLALRNESVLSKPEAVLLSTAQAIYFIPLTQGWGQSVAPDVVIKALQDVLGRPGLQLIGHDLKFEVSLLSNLGIVLTSSLVDLMIADYLLDPNHSNHDLPSCTERYLGERTSLGIKTGYIPSAAPGPEARGHLTQTLHGYQILWPIMEKALKDQNLEKVFYTVDMPLVSVLARMEKKGVFVDADVLHELSLELNSGLEELQKEIYRLAGEEFNINSTKKLQYILFEKHKVHEKQGLKRLKKTKTGWSTDESVLSQLINEPLVAKILEYREVNKLKNTYVDTLPQFINPVTQRLHTKLRQTVAATGRLSSDNPNLQNIPIHSSMAERIRRAFRPQTPDRVMVAADYTQVEIRLLAHLAQEQPLIQAFREGLDIHRATASRIFGVPFDQVTPLLRSRAKAVNFGIIYGMGPQRLARETGVSMGEAKLFIEKYFDAYPGIKEYTQGLIKKARQLGYSESITGRRRTIVGIGDSNRAVVARAENIAVNAPIQGSAADVIKLAMIEIDRRVQKEGLALDMILQIHDELVFECVIKDQMTAIALIREAMEHAIVSSVPLEVSIGIGPDWLSAH